MRNHTGEGVSDLILHVLGDFILILHWPSFTADSDDLHYTLLTR
jgi:hypothetical protein